MGSDGRDVSGEGWNRLWELMLRFGAVLGFAVEGLSPGFTDTL